MVLMEVWLPHDPKYALDRTKYGRATWVAAVAVQRTTMTSGAGDMLCLSLLPATIVQQVRSGDSRKE